ncbi:starvation-inducible DNA-binding protein [Rhizomicrobium palustre]|uniref:Starvation-inducible DNA-binding protein n=1 Tax=Rhizomicrobium palustre TaxID=189966 RepID=A0A846MU85_9PROT|nr:DNA starvation/stationary phase protection protein Dps [Rhizomicrobium palustre]NIK86795.1 starvation-inducible DNA-binding protein [Rhizomicrobium palustre]
MARIISTPGSESDGFTDQMSVPKAIGNIMIRPTRNTLSENIRTQSVDLLNKHLAAVIDLQSQAKQAHWNVQGPNFIAIHNLFDTVSGEAGNYADLIAERTRGLGGIAEGTIHLAVRRSFLVPYGLDISDEQEHVCGISAALAAFGQSVREASDQSADFGDTSTADLFTEISRGIDHQLWLVESHAEPGYITPHRLSRFRS